LELKQVVAALLGATVALLGQALTRRAQKIRTARRLAVAFWEELSAVHFYGPADTPNFAGFSSQTFDSLFRELAETLPEALARDLMRYHWRMKYMEEQKLYTQGRVNLQFWREARGLQERLLERLKHHGNRAFVSLFVRSSETCERTLLRPLSAEDAA
jgi:hypothetical protein